MTHTKIIKIIMAKRKARQGAIGRTFGAKDSSQFFERIYRKNVTFTLFLRVLDLLGYEIVFQPKGNNLPEYSYRMTWDDYKDLPDE